jgi:hypothetical protein
MSVWILTTGNSDIRLKHDRNWNDFFTAISSKLECQEFSSATPINPKDKREGYTVPARVLGLTYSHHPDNFDDLQFPLIDTFFKIIEQDDIQPKLEKIIILLTDQSNLFPEECQRLNEKCAYWQDTICLQPLLTEYFKNKFKGKFNVPIEFIPLIPQSTEGLDYWDATLNLVETKLSNLQISQLTTVYVSHQAGTPAISSAVQFVTLGKFKNVKFLVSNQYYDNDYNQQSEAKIIDSSKYGRGIQIQKAKQLTISGFPGAALKILEQIADKPALERLYEQVDFFNLYSRDTNGNTSNQKDFDIPEATQRIVNALDLVSIFFSNQNYLQGITLIAAAQETFMKVAILSKIATITDTININNQIRRVSELIKWQPLGLFLSSDMHNQDVNTKKQVLNKLNFPQFCLENKSIILENHKDFNATNKNFVLIAWLTKLEPKFKSWSLLKWSCKEKRNSDEDLRNQFLHNLRGMETKDVIQYLLGDDANKNTSDDVMEIYNNKVRQPFFTAIDLLQLSYKREKVYKVLQEIADELV